MSEVKLLLVMIVVLLLGLMAAVDIGIMAITGNQHIEICQDHPTYYRCPGWKN